MIDCSSRPLRTVFFARISIDLEFSNDTLELVQRIEEKLGIFSFQMLRAKTLHQLEIKPKFPTDSTAVFYPLYTKARETDWKP